MMWKQAIINAINKQVEGVKKELIPFVILAPIIIIHNMKIHFSQYVKLIAITILFTLATNLLQAQSEPQITDFSPIVGNVGDEITINGVNFDPTFSDNRVFIGGVEASITGGSSTQLTVTLPQNSYYSKIQVLTSTGLIAESSQFFTPTFTYGHPTIDNSSFSSPVNTATGDSPERVDVKDIDGDGKNDVLISRNSGNFYVYRNTSNIGSVSFSQVSFNEPFNPYQPLLARDLDGDGLPDMIEIGALRAVDIRRNTSTPGSVSFAPKQSFDVTDQEKPGLAVADLDGDGKLDILAQTYGGIKLLRNTSSVGAISFAPAINLGAGGLAIAAADLDGDHLPEIVIANQNSIRIFKNNSTVGTFSFSEQPSLASNSVKEIELVDLDLDGKTDIVGFAPGNQPVGLQVYRNISSGSISFDGRQTYSTGGGSSSDGGFDVGDINGDERPDVVASSGPSNAAVVLLNNSSPGSTSLRSYKSYPTGTTPMDAFVADIDGDNRSDLIVTNINSNNFSV
ncbi:MAG: FG-GAP-like repeat-containing protein, partial [Bacteroidota bacterium]